jgi:type I restriction enzyme R subunit
MITDLKAAARSAVTLGIEDLLNDRLPSRYERTIFSQKCSLVFEHVYEHYPEPNVGTYAHMQ